MSNRDMAQTLCPNHTWRLAYAEGEWGITRVWLCGFCGATRPARRKRLTKVPLRSLR